MFQSQVEGHTIKALLLISRARSFNTTAVLFHVAKKMTPAAPWDEGGSVDATSMPANQHSLAASYGGV